MRNTRGGKIENSFEAYSLTEVVAVRMRFSRTFFPSGETSVNLIPTRK